MWIVQNNEYLKSEFVQPLCGVREIEEAWAVHYTVMKHSGHVENCRTHSPVALVFYISLLFSNAKCSKPCIEYTAHASLFFK